MEYKFKKYKKSEILSGHLKMGGTNPDGVEINANSLYFIRGGKPWIGVMGEYHFVRDNRENWYNELCKMKAGGVTVVATYIFWIYHEEDEGVFDFSGDRDLHEFVSEAGRAGLDVVLRIGPWAHGECRNGGFPDWLMQKPFKLRDNNEGYMEKAEIFYKKIFEQVKGMFWQDGGNIIGIQIENELPDNPEHLRALKELALTVGFNAPLYTVTGWAGDADGGKIPGDEAIPVFGSYPEEPWAGHTRELPLSHNYIFCGERNESTIGNDIIKASRDSGYRLPYERFPFATCEQGGGVQITHMRRPIIDPMDVYAMSLAKLGSGNNLIGYYMYKGGINKVGKHSLLNESKESGYPNECPAISYDFQAPISEYGEIRESYRLINMLHMFANDFGDVLAPMEFTEAEENIVETDLTSLRYAMRTDGERGFVFVNHYQRLAVIKDIEGAVINTGAVTFPPIDVKGEVAFILPFNIDLGGEKLEYATAQLLCREGDIFYFAEVEGVVPEYKFAGTEPKQGEVGGAIEVGGIKVVTLSAQQAKYARKLSGKVYVGIDADIYEAEGKILSCAPGGYAYERFNGESFENYTVDGEFTQAKLTAELCEAPFEIPYPYELNIGGRTHSWKKLSTDGDQGFVEIRDKYDVAQIYVDRRLAADSFYYGKLWRIPAKLLYGKECYMVMSDLRDDFFNEFYKVGNNGNKIRESGK